ncbi:hypothetical protein OIU74_023192 [Salix koriyanagi]|uniref:Uncharacterized protein n=1 Tax=Salix koriyanagi TaxID=2511006 RepID=A0A9Q1AAV2_9ROSI|nr:hypothetical protein OIU74_023192 [Salix koriyanagi]
MEIVANLSLFKPAVVLTCQLLLFVVSDNVNGFSMITPSHLCYSIGLPAEFFMAAAMSKRYCKLVLLGFGVLACSSMTGDGGDGQRVRESIGVFKGENVAGYQRLSVVYKAVVVAKPPENLGVDEASGAEPSTVEVNPGDVTAGGTHVHDLNSVSRYASG